MSDRKTALVLGGTGMVGSNLLRLLESAEDWDLIAVSRRAPSFPTRASHIACDMSNREDCRSKFAGLESVTHIFYCGHVPGIEWVDKVSQDTELLENTLTVLEPRLSQLEHVCLLQGSKYYGRHLGPFKTPAKESDC